MTPRWISEAEVAEILDMSLAIDALRRGFAAEQAGDAASMLKTQVMWGAGHSLHAIGAVMPEAGLVGSKTWAHTGEGATPIEIVWDANTGDLLAIIEAFVLGQFRTGGVSGLATDLLAAKDASSLAIIGTGKQAWTQVVAVASVRPLLAVRVFSRDAGRRIAFAERVEGDLGVAARAFDTVAETVSDADVVTLVTRATEPFLTASMMSPGAHLNAIGAITPNRIEFAPSLLERAEIIVADSPAQARTQSAEFREYFRDDDVAWSSVHSLAELVHSPRRRAADGLSVFKAMGVGVADLSLAKVVLEQSTSRGLGSPLPEPAKGSHRAQSVLK